MQLVYWLECANFLTSIWFPYICKQIWTNTVCAKVSHNVNLLCRLSWFLTQPLLLLFLKSYILPLFNYCDIVWSGSTKSEASRLETLHNYACHTVLRECKGFSPSAACRELGIFALTSRSLAVTMFNCMPSKSPPYLSQFLSSPSSHYNTCSAPSSQLILTPIGPPLAKSHQFHRCSTLAIPATEHPDTRDFTRYYSLCQQHFYQWYLRLLLLACAWYFSDIFFIILHYLLIFIGLLHDFTSQFDFDF